MSELPSGVLRAICILSVVLLWIGICVSVRIAADGAAREKQSGEETQNGQSEGGEKD